MNIILHGGNTKTIDTMNDRLADAMRNAAPNKKIAFCLWAIPDENSAYFSKTQDFLVNFIGDDYDLRFVDNDSVGNDLADCLAWCDVIYFQGGTTATLLERLSPHRDLLVNFNKDKTIVGSSAGACALSQYYIASAPEPQKGLGIIPLSVFVHSNSFDKKPYHAFKKQHPTEPILLIPECHYIELSC